MGQEIEELSGVLGTSLSTKSMVAGREPVILLLCGPSGVGKDSVKEELRRRRPDLHFVITATSRGKRPGERDGVDYHFRSREEFEAMIQGNKLVEHAVVYGDYKGVPRSEVDDVLAAGQDVVVQVDVQGAATFRKLFGKRVVSIFLMAESEAVLAQRLANRKTEDVDKLRTRIATAQSEFRRVGEFDYLVVNKHGELQEAVDQVEAILRVETLHKVSRLVVDQQYAVEKHK